MTEKTLQLRGKERLPSGAGVEQRLLACPIAGQDQRARAVVPDGQTEHSVQLGDRIGAAFEVERKDRFDVGV